MKMKMFSVYDSAAQAYVTPFFMHNKALAIRAFDDNVNSEQENNINKHPDQFSLHEVGEFDDANGIVTPYEKPELVTTARELVKPTTEDDLITQIKALRQQLATQEAN